jgi:hypothetical protein
MICINCNKEYNNDFNFCPYCGMEKKIFNPKYNNVYGNWEVTTEGDVEGRSTKYLGTYEGNIQDIARKLAKKTFYSLSFKNVPKLEEIEDNKNVKEIAIHFDIESGIWDFTDKQRIEKIKELFKNFDNIKICNSNYFVSFIIKYLD